MEVLGVLLGVLERNKKFVLSASVSASDIRSLTQTYAQDGKLKDLAETFHPKATKFIRFYRGLSGNNSGWKLVTDDTGTYYRTQQTHKGTLNDGQKYEDLLVYKFYSYGEVVAQRTIKWGEDQIRKEELYGNYLEGGGLDSFKYDFTYEWGFLYSYSFYSSDINYSTDISQTLKDYVMQTKGSIRVTDENIEYAKKSFNELYEYLKRLIG
jgi:hypothetical protein